MIDNKLEHYVEFLFPGILFPETYIRKIKSRDCKKIKPPKGCFAFTFFDVRVGYYKHSDHNTKLTSDRLNESGRHYIGGEILTVDDVAKMPDKEILLSNMRINKWKHIIKTSQGNFQPLEENDIVLNGVK